MTIRPSDDWTKLARKLADELISAGALTDPEWVRAFVAVPRHVFVPRYYTHRPGMAWDQAAAADCLANIYRDETLVTQVMTLAGQGDRLYATSSSTKPSLMLTMLQLLEVTSGMKVLEIGTGTGYNAALLSGRLGSHSVASVDIDDELTMLARRRLHTVGYRPTLVTRDGRTGYDLGAPFDRILATVAFEHIPYAWVRQTRPGGVILADLRAPGIIQAGALALLTVRPDATAAGSLIDAGPGFMSARTDPAQPASPHVPVVDKSHVRQRASEVSPNRLEEPGLALAIWRELPGIAAFPMTDRLMLTMPDGSWAEVTRKGPAAVEHAGPTDIWADVERITIRWQSMGSPALASYRITVTERGTAITPRKEDDAAVAAP